VKKKSTNFPTSLNITLVISIQIVVLSSLYLASRLEWIWSLPIGLFVSFVLLTNYALVHEAAHDNLNQSAKANRFLGMLSGFLFPISFTFFKIAHTVHHNHNRTDHEMFDYYYPNDNLWIKRAQWYSILIGIYPPLIPVGSILMGFVPWVYKSRPFAKARSSSVLFANNQFNIKDIRKIRIEVVLGFLYWIILWNVLSLSWLSVLIIYAFFCFNWSTRQYVTHAFTPRHVIEGALNLKVSRIMSWILLNSEWDQVHHKKPKVSWIDLPKYADTTMQPISYWRQYLRLWKGPRPNKEPAPDPIKIQ
jgi:fatty acid desaturase